MSETPKGFSKRQRQVAAGVHQVLARTLLNYHCKSLRTLVSNVTLSVTISEVQMSKDLKHARVYCVPFNKVAVEKEDMEKADVLEMDVSEAGTQGGSQPKEAKMSKVLTHKEEVKTLKALTHKDFIKNLNAEAPFLQNELKDQLHFKFLPRLRFYLDHSFDTAERLHQALNALPKPLVEEER